MKCYEQPDSSPVVARAAAGDSFVPEADGCPHFATRDGRLYRVLPDGSEEPYWSPEEGRVLGQADGVPKDEPTDATEPKGRERR